MIILFLDDNEFRHRIFKTNNLNHKICCVYNTEEAISALNLNPQFDLVCLDHDLGGVYGAASDDKSGYAVAEYISKMNDDIRPKNIIIHSWNGPGAKRMLDVLLNAGIKAIYMPFNEEMKIND